MKNIALLTLAFIAITTGFSSLALAEVYQKDMIPLKNQRLSRDDIQWQKRSFYDGTWQITKFTDFDNRNKTLDNAIAADKWAVRRQAVVDATFIGQGVKAASNFVQRQFDEQPEIYRPLNDLPSGYEMNAGAFVDAKSPAEVTRIKSQIDSSRMLRRYQETHPVEFAIFHYVPAAAEIIAIAGFIISFLGAGAKVRAGIKAAPSALLRFFIFCWQKRDDFMKKLKPAWLELIAAIMLIVATFDTPYGYYTFLRICITIACVVTVVRDYNKRKDISLVSIFFGLSAILMNPIIPIHLDKESWGVVNSVMAVAFGLMAWVKIKKIF